MKIGNSILFALLACTTSTLNANVNFDPHFIYSPVEAPKSPLASTWDATQTVLSSGSARRSYSFPVPPGTTEAATPELILQLINRRKGRPGLLGLSWGIAQTYIVRDDKATKRYFPDDEFYFVLRGERHKLKPIGSGEYRTEVDIAARIFQISGGPGGEHWKVEFPGGTILELGNTHDSAYMANTKDASVGFLSKAYLKKHTDTNGNSIFYNYVKDPAPGDDGAIYPSSIEYGVNRLQKITFSYSPRIELEIFPFVEYGSWIQSGQHLYEIEMRSAGNLVRKFRIHYENNSIGTRQRVSRVEEIGDDGSTKRDTLRLTYKPFMPASQSPGFDNNAKIWSEKEHWLRKTDDDSDLVRDVLDLNCDSYPDLVFYEDEDGPRRFDIKAGRPDGSFDQNRISWPIPADDVDQLRDIVGEEGKAPDVHGTFMHADGDQCIDYVHANGRSVQIYKNTGSGLALHRSIGAPYHVKIDDAQRPGDGKAPNVRNGVRHFNPDPFPDLVRRVTNDDGSRSWEIYWGTENGGYIFDGPWRAPGIGWLVDLESDDGDTESTLTDINGDGYLDYVMADGQGNGGWRLFINTGSNLVEIPCSGCTELDDDFVDMYSSERGDVEKSTAYDINADGIPDHMKAGHNGDAYDERIYKVYYGTGHGFTGLHHWRFPNSIPQDGFLRDQSRGDEPNHSRTRRDFIDMDGDGDLDLARRADDHIWVNINPVENADLIDTIQEVAGGIVTVRYRTSNDVYSPALGQNPNPEMPYAMQVVDTLTRDNDMPYGQAHHIEATERYEYRGGEYDSEDRQLKGFSNVKVTRADLATEQHRSHLNKPHRGKEHYVSVQDVTEILPSQETLTTWVGKPTIGGLSGSVPSRITEKTYNGNPTPQVIVTDRNFDQYLNETRRSEQGDTAVVGDERTTDTVYANIPGKYIKNRPKTVTIRDSNGSVLRRTNSVFDPNGNESIRREWRDDGDDPTTQWIYTAEGLVDKVIDAGDSVTDTDYDLQFKSFPEKETNAENHLIERRFDTGTGQVVWEKAPNGGISEFDYDPFKRPTKTARPGDALASPTEQLIYDTNGRAPERVITLHKGNGITERTQAFVDGFGFVLQTRQDAENGMYATLDHYWDIRGRYNGATVPYFTLSPPLGEPGTNVGRSRLHYDVLDRITQFDNPDNTFVKQDYNHSVVTRTDERGVPKDFHVDAYNQVRQIVEHNDTEDYTTIIDVNVVGDLSRIVDTLGNQTVFYMNSLGWFMGINHPAMGPWRYTRQAMGEILSQTDARGITRTIEHDNIYRPILITNPNSADTVLTYDENGDIGALTSYSSVAGTVKRWYNLRLRKTTEQRSLDGHLWTMQQEYDPQDRVTAKVYPDGERVTYSYNKRGLLNAVTGDQPLVTGTNYNASDLPMQINYGNGISTERGYDPDRLWPISIVSTGLQDFSITYDNVGNPESIFENIEGRMQSFQYDSISRLIRATDDISQRSFDFTPVHALSNVTIDGETIEYDHSGANPYAPSAIITDETMVPRHYRN